jgi:hypothetical protein
VVIHDFDVVRVALAEFETDTPTLVDRHRPLSLQGNADCPAGKSPKSLSSPFAENIPLGD